MSSKKTTSISKATKNSNSLPANLETVNNKEITSIDLDNKSYPNTPPKQHAIVSPHKTIDEIENYFTENCTTIFLDDEVSTTTPEECDAGDASKVRFVYLKGLGRTAIRFSARFS